MRQKAIGRKPIGGKKLIRLMRQIRADVQYIAAHVTPPFAPEEFATASFTAQELITQLIEKDKKDKSRMGALVPILLYDALILASITGLTTELSAKREQR